jgi:hypothetical protein
MTTRERENCHYFFLASQSPLNWILVGRICAKSGYSVAEITRKSFRRKILAENQRKESSSLWNIDQGHTRF